MSVLRASGDFFIPQSFLRDSIFQPCNVFLKGERRSESSVWDTSGITVPISEAELDDFEKQANDCVEFLRTNRDELFRLKAFEGIDDLRLDFGVARRKVFAQFQRFPSQLVELAGELGMGIDLSIYG